MLVNDGPHTETKEHPGGFWVREVADMDKALAWGRKAVIACRASVEVPRLRCRLTTSSASCPVFQ